MGTGEVIRANHNPGNHPKVGKTGIKWNNTSPGSEFKEFQESAELPAGMQVQIQIAD